MPTDAKTLQIGTANELLADIRNAGTPFYEKNIMIFSHRYVAGTDYTVGNNLTITVDGAQEILFADIKEVLAATNSALGFSETNKVLTTAATNGSSLAIQVNLIVKV
jgi:hypothetical protein